MSNESNLRDIIRELIRNELEEATSNASGKCFLQNTS